MKPYYQDARVTLYHGDCMDVMAPLPAESVDAIVTSPPYAMQRKSTYGGIPEAEYPAWTVRWMNEARRILKPDGSVIINIRPHIKNGQISDYVLRTRLALRGDGWNECEELIWHKKSSMPVGSISRPRRSWESLLWFAKHGKPWSDPKAHGVPAKHPAQRMRNSLANREGWSHAAGTGGEFGSVSRVSDVADICRVNQRQEFAHPAPYPWELAEWCGKLICPPGGTILDPFSGAASTGVAAIKNGWDYIGVDSVEEYVEMSARRLGAEQEETPRTTGA